MLLVAEVCFPGGFAVVLLTCSVGVQLQRIFNGEDDKRWVVFRFDWFEMVDVWLAVWLSKLALFFNDRGLFVISVRTPPVSNSNKFLW